MALSHRSRSEVVLKHPWRKKLYGADGRNGSEYYKETIHGVHMKKGLHCALVTASVLKASALDVVRKVVGSIVFVSGTFIHSDPS